jgi:hypothetical protein
VTFEIRSTQSGHPPSSVVRGASLNSEVTEALLFNTVEDATCRDSRLYKTNKIYENNSHFDKNRAPFWKRLSWRMERRSSSKGLWDLLPLDAGVFFTAGIADEEHGLSGIITED